MYYEKTGDLQAREDAFRSLNYATYFSDDQGRIACCGLDYADSYWFDDGYGDHIRHYLWAMGAIPEFAPIRENHLLRSSSVVTHVSYGNVSIEYKTFDSVAYRRYCGSVLPLPNSSGHHAPFTIGQPCDRRIYPQASCRGRFSRANPSPCSGRDQSDASELARWRSVFGRPVASSVPLPDAV